jgi:hypothetical protein
MAASPADPSAAPAGEGRGNRWVLLGLVAALGLEFGLFWVGTARHYAWIYPRWFDQAGYLGSAYGGYADSRGRGFMAASAAALARPSPQGALHPLLAGWAFAIAGPSRIGALAVNMVAFLALQAATFAAVRRLSGGWPLAWAALGLLAALAVPWSGGPGSATDFRLDWLAACTYGVALATAVRGRGFRSAGWSALFGAAVGVVLLARYLTGVYFTLIFLGAAAWILAGRERRRRLARLALAGGCAAVVAGWSYWRNRALIYDYYWIGQFAGPEHALHDAHLGALAAAGWFAREVLERDLGPAALAVAAGAAAALWYFSGYPDRGPPAARSTRADAWVVAALFFAAPALVLLLHPYRAAQVLVILVAPAAWLIVLAWIQLARRSTVRALRTVAAGVGVAGGVVLAHGVLTAAYTPAEEHQYRAVNALGDYLHYRAEEAGLGQPRLAVPWLLDGVGSPMFRVLGFERHGRLISYEGELPSGLFAADPGLVRSRLAASDFVCLVTRAPPFFPFDRQMAAMLPENRRWCDDHLRHVGTLDEEGFSAVIYERRGLAAPAGGADLAVLLRSAETNDPWIIPSPPGPPLAPEPEPILWSTARPVRYQPVAAYGPVRFTPVAVPAELSCAPGDGLLAGHFPQPGTFRVSLTATNAVGATPIQLEFRVVAADWAADVDAPPTAEGRTADLHFRAFDGGGRLNYIDVTDLTAGKLLDRVVPNEDQHESWSGRFPATFNSAGPHRVQLRFVRYDPAAAVAYTYLDQERVIVVGR